MKTIFILFILAALGFSGRAEAHGGKICSNFTSRIQISDDAVTITDFDEVTKREFHNATADDETWPADSRAEIHQEIVQCVPGDKLKFITTVEKVTIQKKDANTGRADFDESLRNGIESFVICREQSLLPCIRGSRDRH